LIVEKCFRTENFKSPVEQRFYPCSFAMKRLKT
jgi:hypothetical protein